MPITFTAKGDFKKTNSFLEKIKEKVRMGNLDKYGRAGVEALSAATPVDTGELSNSWYYEIEHSKNSSKIIFKNSADDGQQVPLAVLIQYGHATRNGGYVEGRDFINPAIQPVFDKIAEEAWKEVTSK